MQLLFKTSTGGVFRPAKLTFSVIQALPDRPSGAYELCPTAHLLADTIGRLHDSQSIDTLTGLIAANNTGWMIVSMRAGATAVVMALDVGDKVVQRWLTDAPPIGPVVGLWSPTAARAVRLPVTDALQGIRRHARTAIPAGRQDRQELLDRLFDCIECGELATSLKRAGAEALQVDLALQLTEAGDEPMPGRADELMH